MGCCCGHGADCELPSLEEQRQRMSEPHITPYSARKYRDVFCLVMYILFWIGLLAVAVLSVALGDPRRILYGLDGYGNTCGAENNWNGTGGPNLTSKKKLYYLSPYDLLNPVNLIFGRSICVESCPASAFTCGLGELPCTDASSFRCPYYQVAEHSLYGTLQGVGDWDTNYWAQLNTTSKAQCPAQVTDTAIATLGQIVGRSANSSSIVSPKDPGFPGSSCGDLLQASSSVGRGPCYPAMVNSTVVFNRCLPNFDDGFLNAMSDSTDGGVWDILQAVWDATRLERFFVDVTRCWIVILIVGVLIAVVLAVVWLILLRFFGGVMIWLTIILVNAALMACILFCFSLAGKLGNAGEVGEWLERQMLAELGPLDKDQKIWEWLAYTTIVLEVVVLFISIALATKVRLAVAIVKVGIEAIGTIPSLVVLPFFPMLVEAIFIAAWLVVGAFMWSCGEVVAVRGGEASWPLSSTVLSSLSQVTGIPFSPDQRLDGSDMGSDAAAEETGFASCVMDADCRYEIRWPTAFWYMAAYHVFGLLWTTQFIAGYTTVVVSGSVANFYWNRGTRGGPRNNTSPLAWALGTTFCCHMGSIALGSFVLAAVFFIRVILEYIYRKVKSTVKDTPCGMVLNCFRCCCWLFEKFLEFINRNTLIMVGIKGKGYCSSAARATALLVSNVVRVAVVNTVSGFLMWLGKILVMACCGVLAFLICNLPVFKDPVNFPDFYLSSRIVPVVCCVLVSYLITDVYFQMYDVVVDTILLAFCEDCEQNDNHPRYAPPLLLKAIGEQRPKPIPNHGPLAAPVSAALPPSDVSVVRGQG